MKYSILVTAYDPDRKMTDVTVECLESIIKNSEGKDYEILMDNEPGGVFGAYNRLFKKARGEYFIVVPNDTVIYSPDWLEELAVPGFITSWHIGTFLMTGNPEPDGGVTCYPRDIVEKIGYYDEQFDQGYGFGDNDYFHRATLLGINYKAVPVKIKHLGSETWKHYNSEKKMLLTVKNQDLFKEKWKL